MGGYLKILILLFCASAYAGEGELRLNVDSAQSRKSIEADNIITNRQLRAASGSTSLWSIGSSFNYNGASLNKPLGQNRPNISGTTATTDVSLLDGQANIKYNLAAAHSLNAGVGMRWLTPFGDQQKFDASNPFVTYQYLFNLAGMESVLQVQPTFYTESNLTALGYSWSLLLNQDSAMEIGSSGLTLGYSAWIQYGMYNKNDQAVLSAQADWIFGFSPLLEYQFNDTFNFRTVFNIWNFEHLRSQTNRAKYLNDRVTQSMGWVSP